MDIDDLYEKLKDIVHGPVCVVDEYTLEVVYRCPTIEEAENYIASLELTYPDDVHAGRYGVDAPESMHKRTE